MRRSHGSRSSGRGIASKAAVTLVSIGMASSGEVGSASSSVIAVSCSGLTARVVWVTYQRSISVATETAMPSSAEAGELMGVNDA